jgi:4-aminobutyrate aminotransferase
MDRATAVPDVETVPGERAEQWVTHHQRHAATSTFVYEFVWDTTSPAVGPFCTDVDGNVLLDFASHVASSPLGYNNPKLTDRLEEFGVVDPLKIAGQDFCVSAGWPPEDPDLPGPTQLLDELVELTDHYGLETAFLSNSGAEAIENAIKVCYATVGGDYGITFDGAFHGRTLGALSLNRSKAVHRRGYPEIAGIESVPFCTDRTCDPSSCSCGFFRGGGPGTETGADPGDASGDRRSALAAMLGEEGRLDPADVSYVVVEPVQGEGGYRFPSEAFMDELAAVVDRHDIPLIADEIQTGLGRTGEMWGADHYAIEPDVITSAKALRVGATVGRPELFPEEQGRLSSTWGGGDLLGSLLGVLTIEAIRDHDLLANARERGDQFTRRVREDLPPFVTDVRGKGLLLALEFDSKARRDAAICTAFRHGLLTLGCGHRTLRVLPPLDVTAREIDIGVDLLHDTFEDDSVRTPSPRRTDTGEVT